MLPVALRGYEMWSHIQESTQIKNNGIEMNIWTAERRSKAR
jgi:hypothetical protein